MTRVSLNLASVALLALMFVGCGDSPDPNIVEEGASQEGSESSIPTETEEAEEEQGSLIDSGFGQSGQYVWVTALVENVSDHGGQTVTVNFNALDESGKVINSVSQVGSFDIAGQRVAVGTQMDVGPRVKVASVEPTLLVEDEGIFEEIDMDYGSVEATSITQEQYVDDQWVAKFAIKNPTDEPLQNLGIGIICKGQNGNINGGGVEFPELIPPSGEVVIEPHLITSGEPRSCTAYVGGPVF